mgnify:CR=1 FL=1
MSYSFQLFLFFYVPTTWLLVSFSAAWIFSCSLTLRKNYQHPLLHCYLIFSLLLLPTVIYFWTELHAWLLQIGIFVGLAYSFTIVHGQYAEYCWGGLIAGLSAIGYYEIAFKKGENDEK